MLFKMFITAKCGYGMNIFWPQDKMKNAAYVFITNLEELVCRVLWDSCLIVISVRRREWGCKK